MAHKNVVDGTLLMALELGAAWPSVFRSLKNTESNFQAVVQDRSESAEQFARRALARWNRLLYTSAPPHRFVLGTGINPDEQAAAARRQLANGVLEKISSPGQSEFILWAGSARSGEEQGRLLELAGSLVETRRGVPCSVRVLFGDSAPILLENLPTGDQGNPHALMQRSGRTH
jgi:hypothetical protein